MNVRARRPILSTNNIIIINEYCDQFIFGLGLVLNDNLDNLVSSLDSLMTFLSFKIHG